MMGEWDNDWDVAATREVLGLSHAADLTETAGGSIGSPWAATWAHASGATAAAMPPRCTCCPSWPRAPPPPPPPPLVRGEIMGRVIIIRAD
jgi:hypothetical protein